MVIDSHLAADTQTIDPSAMSCRSSGLEGDERETEHRKTILQRDRQEVSRISMRREIETDKQKQRESQTRNK